MTAALAMVGGASAASSALATERTMDSDAERAIEDGEGSGEAVEGREDLTCKPWMCAQPLYGVVPIDDWELRGTEGGGGGDDGGQTTDDANERR